MENKTDKTDEQIPMVPVNGPCKEETAPPKPPISAKTHWIDLAARVIFPFIYFSFVIFYWIYYINHPDSALSANAIA